MGIFGQEVMFCPFSRTLKKLTKIEKSMDLIFSYVGTPSDITCHEKTEPSKCVVADINVHI